MTDESNERRRPSLGLLRRLTDDHVIDQLLTTAELTRAELAARTGISKPTISESVRRLEAAGLVDESGRQGGRRGPSASYYRLRAESASALAMAVGPDGIHAQLLDLRGDRIADLTDDVPNPVRAADLGPAILRAVETVLAGQHGPVFAASISVANPVDWRTGQLVRLTDSPFLVDELNLVTLLRGPLGYAAEIDNDVNWAALAEHRVGGAQDLEDFVYCYLGPGLGAGVISGGTIVRGARGLAGEFAHVNTVGPGGRSRRLVSCFADWELLQPGSAAIDVPQLTEVLTSPRLDDRRRRGEVVEALAGAIGSVTALLNPAGVVVGGPWSGVDGLIEELDAAVRRDASVSTRIRAAELGAQAPLIGARSEAVRRAQDLIRAR